MKYPGEESYITGLWLLFVSQGTFCLWLFLTLNFALGLALDKKYPSKKTKKRRKKGINFAGVSRLKFLSVCFKEISLKIFHFILARCLL